VFTTNIHNCLLRYVTDGCERILYGVPANSLSLSLRGYQRSLMSQPRHNDADLFDLDAQPRSNTLTAPVQQTSRYPNR